MTTDPEAVQARGLLATFGDKTGIDHQGLLMGRRDHADDRRLVERDKGKVSRVPTGKGPLVIRTVTAQIPTRGMAWEHKQQSQQMRQKLLLRFLGLA
jgi:hypothetical protein